MAEFQGAKATVKGMLEPGLDQCSESVCPTAAKERQADKVFWEWAKVIGVAVDAGEPASPYRLLWLILPGEHRLWMDLWWGQSVPVKKQYIDI